MKKKFLVIVDESQELLNAIHFAARRAINTEGDLILLYIIDPALNAQWATIGNLIEQEATSEAKKICREWSQKIKKQFNLESEVIFKIGDRVDEIIKLIADDEDIRFLILASSPNSEDPGPLIKTLTGKRSKDLNIPVVIVPGSLTEKDIELIA